MDDETLDLINRLSDTAVIIPSHIECICGSIAVETKRLIAKMELRLKYVAEKAFPCYVNCRVISFKHPPMSCLRMVDFEVNDGQLFSIFSVSIDQLDIPFDIIIESQILNHFRERIKRGLKTDKFKIEPEP